MLVDEFFGGERLKRREGGGFYSFFGVGGVKVVLGREM